MADGPITGSESYIENPCVVCLKTKNRNIESCKYCVQCQVYLCSECEIVHDAFPLLSNHVLTNKVHQIDLTGVPLDPQSQKSGHSILAICSVTRNNRRFTILSSWYEKKLIVLDDVFGVVHNLPWTDKIRGICELERSNQLAMLAKNETYMYTVKMGDDGTMNKSDVYSAPKSCKGIVTFEDMFGEGLVTVSGGGNYTKASVNVYSLTSSSELVSTQKFSASFNNLNTLPRDVALDKKNRLVYFTDSDVGVLAMDTSGKIRLFVDTSKSTCQLKGARGICLDDNGDIYVAGRTSNNVVKYRADGSMAGEIVNQSHGIEQPLTLYYDRVRRHLFIGCSGDVNVDLFYVRL